MSQKWMIAGVAGLLSMFVTTAGGILIFVTGIKTDPPRVVAPAPKPEPPGKSSASFEILDGASRDEIINNVPVPGNGRVIMMPPTRGGG